MNPLIRTKNRMTASYQTQDEQLAALKWQMDMGIDCALSDKAQGLKFADISMRQAVASDQPSRPTPSKEAQNAQPQNVDGTPKSPRALNAVKTLEELKAALNAFEGCALKKTASNLVFADGNPAADIMLIGEAPGKDEDRMGLPFVGAAGQLLDRMLKSIGLDRQDVYITNILPWRPPGNRTPSVEETQMLWPFLRRHIQIKAPKIIFALGGSSAKLLLNSQTGILKLRGNLEKIDFSDSQDGSMFIPVLPSLHPAYLLRAPNMKKQSFSDLLDLKSFIE